MLGEIPAWPLLPAQDAAAWPSSDDGPGGEVSVCVPGQLCAKWQLKDWTEAFSLGLFVSGPWATGVGRDCWRKNVR